jgi:hypothetical protein
MICTASSSRGCLLRPFRVMLARVFLSQIYHLTTPAWISTNSLQLWMTWRNWRRRCRL